MKKVFLYAYDRINLGDDLFVHTIAKRYPQVQFYLWTREENKKTFQMIKNLKVIEQDSKYLKLLGKLRQSFPARYKARVERKCDAVVYIGGSLFIEYDNWENILNWWEYEADNRNFYVLGANFGPYKSAAYRERLNAIFYKMKNICFRDEFSYRIFEKNERVRKASDILFSYEMPQADIAKKQIFVSVIDPFHKDEGSNKLSIYENEYIAKLTEILKKYLKEGYSVVLSSFCKYEGDEKAVKKIFTDLNDYKNEKVHIRNYDGTNAEQILVSIAESQFVIASRFHAMVLGIVAGKVVFPIVYSDKTIHVLEDIGFQGEYADVRNLKELTYEKMQRSFEKLPELSIKELRKSAENHFVKLDEVLKE